MKVLVPLGTRPEIVKLAPVVRALRDAGTTVQVVATGQHHDPSLTDTFFAGLGLRPDMRWTLPSDEANRVGTMLSLAYGLLADQRPDVVLLLGDTYTVPLFCLAARRFRVPVAHLEAGLRSFNPTSMEEVDRRVAGTLASLHLAPTALAAEFLRREGVEDERIHVVGNPVIDVLRAAGVTRRPLDERAGVVFTAHRASNVDDPARLGLVVDVLLRLAGAAGPVTFPVHPRTMDRLGAAGALEALRHAGVRLLPPVPWDDMLGLLAACRVVVTDSGGLQEEASYLGLPVVVLRRSTPRWEGVAARTSVLTGLDVDRVLAAVTELAGDDAQARVAAVPCPYGDGRTGERVAALLADPDVTRLLAIDEPDYVGSPPPC